MAASIALRGVWFRDRKWRKVMGITQYLPNKKEAYFPESFYMLRIKFNVYEDFQVDFACASMPFSVLRYVDQNFIFYICF